MNQNDCYVYPFVPGNVRGDRFMVDMLGGKGANLAEMTALGLPVPPGFTISTEGFRAYQAKGYFQDDLWLQILQGVTVLEDVTGQVFGAEKDHNPLLLSVRSGAKFSMPGMMDTILNVGLTNQNVPLLAKHTSPFFAWDSYRRFIQSYASTVMCVPCEIFESILGKMRNYLGVRYDFEIGENMEQVAHIFLSMVEAITGSSFPQHPLLQFSESIEAVFRSWNGARAVEYRRIHKIPNDLGTAVNVQAMVFGNRNPRSGTGVIFTRSPSTGERQIFAEYLSRAQGDDVVAGVRTPMSLDGLKWHMPVAYSDLQDICRILENQYSDMLDIEFTIEDEKLWILQVRRGERTATAEIKIAVDLVREGAFSQKEAILRVSPEQLKTCLHQCFNQSALKDANQIGCGLPASPGAGAGIIVFTAERAVLLAQQGAKIILVRRETSPDDIAGMHVAEGILTARGGMTSHVAVVARGMNKPTVVGSRDLVFPSDGSVMVGVDTFHEGDLISIDGSTGAIYAGAIAIDAEVALSEEARTLLLWADGIRNLGVFANADTPEGVARAFEAGAEGIGLVRTEHMFFTDGRLSLMQEMILSETEERRRACLDALANMQREDFQKIFHIANGRPVVIRLLDPPLHEFLPKGDERTEAFREENPMLGTRGCRIGVLHPEITRMQVRAIGEAMADLILEGIAVQPKIMIPFTAFTGELCHQKGVIGKVLHDIERARNVQLIIPVGAMIELLRMALKADECATQANFFSFGTNDLTQTALGLSRDDTTMVVQTYLEQGILARDPFVSLDEGVAELIEMCVQRVRHCDPFFEIGICGEHGADPMSIEFFDRIGLSYVSVSGNNVYIARLASAQATINNEKEKKHIQRSPFSRRFLHVT